MRASLGRYVRVHAFGNVESRDWWRLVAAEMAGDNETASTAFEEAMMDWTILRGVPVVNVRRNYKQKTITLTQERFQDANGNLTAFCWPIPIAHISSHPARRPSSVHTVQWLPCHNRSASQAFVLPQRIEPNHYILLNADNSVPYHVRYDTRNWRMLLEQLAGPRFRKICVRTRAQLMDDYFLSLSSKDRFTKYSKRLVKWLHHEDAELPWSVAMQHLIKRWPTSGKKGKNKYQVNIAFRLLVTITIPKMIHIQCSFHVNRLILTA